MNMKTSVASILFHVLIYGLLLMLLLIFLDIHLYV
ncbi:O-fucosyltransferase 7 [Bienertia sinuspersici]